MRNLRARGWVLAVVAAAGFCAPATAQPTETDVKAAFLPRFARYVTWPAYAVPGGSDPFVLCVIGNDPFGAVLDSAAKSQSVNGRRIVVRRLDAATSAAQCQIAFVGGNDQQSASDILTALQSLPVLTVTDSKTGAARGIIHFSVVRGRVRFSIDDVRADAQGLSISSRLLALAISVRQR